MNDKGPFNHLVERSSEPAISRLVGGRSAAHPLAFRCRVGLQGHLSCSTAVPLRSRSPRRRGRGGCGALDVGRQRGAGRFAGRAASWRESRHSPPWWVRRARSSPVHDVPPARSRGTEGRRQSPQRAAEPPSGRPPSRGGLWHEVTSRWRSRDWQTLPELRKAHRDLVPHPAAGTERWVDDR